MRAEEEYEEWQNQGKEENRPATLEDLKTTINLLNQYGVPYVLIGGYALMLKGNQRATKDIDILLPIGAEVGKSVKAALAQLPQNAIKDVEDSWFEEDDTIRVADEFTVDLLFKCGGGNYNYNNLSQHATEIEFEGIKVKTIDLEGLWKTNGSRERHVGSIIFKRKIQTRKSKLGLPRFRHVF